VKALLRGRRLPDIDFLDLASEAGTDLADGDRHIDSLSQRSLL
jgi:hypothetical protein